MMKLFLTLVPSCAEKVLLVFMKDVQGPDTGGLNVVDFTVTDYSLYKVEIINTQSGKPRKNFSIKKTRIGVYAFFISLKTRCLSPIGTNEYPTDTSQQNTSMSRTPSDGGFIHLPSFFNQDEGHASSSSSSLRFDR